MQSTIIKKPKLEDFKSCNDLTGEKSYTNYRKAKNEYIKSKKNLYMNLREEFLSLITNFSNLSPESELTATITAQSTGELMDLAIEHKCDIIHPFTDNANQSHYYFNYPIKKNIVLKVKSLPKKYK